MANETKNVKLSIEEKLESVYSGVSIDWQGTDFDSDGVTAWVEPRILGFSSSPMRLAERFEGWTLSINCYAKTGPGGEDTHKVWELVDTAIGGFSQATLAIKDFAQSAQPTLSRMRFTEADVSPFPSTGERPKETQELQQVNVTFTGVLIT